MDNIFKTICKCNYYTSADDNSIKYNHLIIDKQYIFTVEYHHDDIIYYLINPDDEKEQLRYYYKNLNINKFLPDNSFTNFFYTKEELLQLKLNLLIN